MLAQLTRPSGLLVGQTSLFSGAMLSIARSFFDENGQKGSNAIDRLAHSCNDRFNMTATLSLSVFITFHGSVSVRYLFPRRAIFMASLRASLNLKFSKLFCSCSLILGIE